MDHYLYFSTKKSRNSKYFNDLKFSISGYIKNVTIGKKIVAEKNYLNNIEYISGNFSKDIKFLIEKNVKIKML